MKKIIFFLLLLALPAQAKPYLDIREIKTPAGLTVWAVQDKTVPVMALKFSLKGGSQFDPQGLEGVSNLLTTLFDEGAGKRNAEEFQDLLDSHGISMGFGAGRDSFGGGLKTTIQYKDLAVGMFSDAVNDPHFKPEAVERMRQAILSDLRSQEMDPGFIAQKKLFGDIFAGHAYARLTDGTPETVAKITRDNLVAQRKTLFCRDHLKIAVVGDVTEKDIAATVDKIFGTWPACKTKPAAKLEKLSHAGETMRVTWQGAQDTVILVQPGLARRDKDWWAARILDFALGGGEFSSRLMDEVRVKRGLTYGIGSSLVPYDLAPLWFIQGGIDPGKTDEAIALTKKIWGDVAANGLTDAEIAEAKAYMIGSLPLALTSSDQIAAILMQLQEDNLPKNMLDIRADEINAVTVADIKRVARERLKPEELTTIIVGPVKETKK